WVRGHVEELPSVRRQDGVRREWVPKSWDRRYGSIEIDPPERRVPATPREESVIPGREDPRDSEIVRIAVPCLRELDLAGTAGCNVDHFDEGATVPAAGQEDRSTVPAPCEVARAFARVVSRQKVRGTSVSGNEPDVLVALGHLGEQREL